MKTPYLFAAFLVANLYDVYAHLDSEVQEIFGTLKNQFGEQRMMHNKKIQSIAESILDQIQDNVPLPPIYQFPDDPTTNIVFPTASACRDTKLGSLKNSLGLAIASIANENTRPFAGETFVGIEWKLIGSKPQTAKVQFIIAVYRYGEPQKQLKPAELQAVRDNFIKVHNMFREFHGSGPLVYDPKLNEGAQKYALELASTDKWEHSEVAQNGIYGENLAKSGSHKSLNRGFRAAHFACLNWYKEETFYTDYENPNEAEIGKWGHFTAMVWKATTRIGVGIAYGKMRSNSGLPINGVWVVTRYLDANDNPGNQKGEYVDNVTNVDKGLNTYTVSSLTAVFP